MTISLTGLPQSVASISANSSARSRSTLATRFNSRARSSGGVLRQPSKAFFAAPTAASMSSAPQSATGPSDSPVPDGRADAAARL
jgi:hypothetical protein